MSRFCPLCHAEVSSIDFAFSPKAKADVLRLEVAHMKAEHSEIQRFDEAHARLKRELPNAGGQGVQSSMKL